MSRKALGTLGNTSSLGFPALPWDYDVDGPRGPQHWGSLVNSSSGELLYPLCDAARPGSIQSPINLVDAGKGALRGPLPVIKDSRGSLPITGIYTKSFMNVQYTLAREFDAITAWHFPSRAISFSRTSSSS